MNAYGKEASAVNSKHPVESDVVWPLPPADLSLRQEAASAIARLREHRTADTSHWGMYVYPIPGVPDGMFNGTRDISTVIQFASELLEQSGK